MNQEKIGKFILELRKEKNMTQKELSEKIGVTDRAISKWENGRGMPDLSLLIPLCDVLDISINELLSGERLNKKDYQEKLEENIINTIDFSNTKIKKTRKIFLIILLIVFISISIIITMFSIDVNRMRNNKPVVFSTWGYSYVPPIDIKEEEIEFAITNYLITKGDNEYKHHDTIKSFASMKTYLLEEIERNKEYNIYAFVLEEKYYLENESIKKDSSSAIPYKFTVKKIDDKFLVTDSRIPRDGSYYQIDMKNIFPKDIRDDIGISYTDGTIEILELDILSQVNLYFHE